MPPLRRILPADGDDTRLSSVIVQAGASRVGLALRHRVLNKKRVWSTKADCRGIVLFDG